ncbi:MAG: hypothetical protein ACRELC_11435, partial [Gemmatimonadota bacterium]
MARRSKTFEGPAIARRAAGTAAVTMALLSLAACEVEWGGGRIALEDPAPPPDTAAARAEGRDERIVPIPDGPLLYLVRIGPGAGAWVVPAARLGVDAGGGRLAGLSIPDSVDEGYRARFDSTFLAPGTELELHVRGSRVGSVVLSGPPRVVDAGCPAVTAGRLLVTPGQALPPLALALPRLGVATPPSPAPEPDLSRSMVVAAPVLAERLLADPRSFLARRVDLQAVML